MNKYYILRTKLISRVIPLKSILVITLFLLIMISLITVSLLSGKSDLSFFDLLKILFFKNDNTYGNFIIFENRLPRIFLALIVGALLGISGLILQVLVKNPLASPDILGISNGASVGILIFLSYFINFLSIAYLPLASMIGAFITIFLVYIFSMNKKLIPQRIILIGMALSLFMGAISTFLFVFGSSQATLVAYLWLTGSVYGANWEEIKIVLIFVSFTFPFLILVTRHISYLELNEDSCTTLGLNVSKLRVLLLFCSVSFAAIAISFAGAISFVGLISPHIAKRLIENDFSYLVFLSGIIGACIVLLADLIGRTMFTPLDLPAGIFVSLIGAPFFIYLLFKQLNSRKT